MKDGIRPSVLAVLLIFVLLLVGCDHATKFVAEQALAAGPMNVVPGVLDLHYSPNPDIAFSALRAVTFPAAIDKRWLLVGVAAFASLALTLVAWRRRRHAHELELVGWALVLAGALGNVLDRAVRGYVVDFLRLPHWPVFNLADVFIVIGALAVAGSGILVACGVLVTSAPSSSRPSSRP